MWKCKRCEKNVFAEKVIDGNQVSEFGKNGEHIKILTEFLKLGEVYCCNCGNMGLKVQDVATWVEEEEK